MALCARCGAENGPGLKFCGECGTRLAAVSPPAEVRKTVTVLFSDFAGSTALGEQLDPEILRALMNRYFAEMRTVIERHGGTVEKFIGDAVMAVFGIPKVHEDDALRAVRAAWDIRDSIERLNLEVGAKRGVAVAARTGVNTGEVVAGDPASGATLVTGDTVNTAARLEQAAAPGHVLLGAPTYQLVRDAVEAEAVAPIAAKGKAVPVAAFRLINVHHGAEGRARRLDAPLVGRGDELARLNEAFKRSVANRQPHLVTVVGVAGLGKSRLVSEFVGSATADARVLKGRCLPYGEGITYWPLREIVYDAAAITESDDASDARTKLRGLFDGDPDGELLTTRVAAALGLEGASVPQDEIFWATRKLFERLATERPVITVWEDIHWAEQTLLDLLEYIVDLATDTALLVICPARPELLETRPGWGGGNRANSTVLRLESLTDEAAGALLDALPAGAALPPGVRARVVTAAEGNPLYLEEMVAMLLDQGLLERSGGGWRATSDIERTEVPASIRALLAARIDALPNEELDVAKRASVVGRVFEAAAVRELAPDSAAGVGRSLLSLVRKELIRPERSELTAGDAFKFRHVLIRDAAYEALPKAERAVLHERFAEWLEHVAGERLREYAEIVGYHAQQAYRLRLDLGPLDEHGRRLAAKAAEHFGAAGMRALDRTDVNAARKLLAAAVELIDPSHPTRLRLQAELGLALALAGELRAADSLLSRTIEEAEAAGDVLSRAYAQLGRIEATEMMSPRPIDEVIEEVTFLVQVFDEHGDERAAERAALELARHHFFAGRAAMAEEIMLQRLSRFDPTEPLPGLIVRWLPTFTTFGPTPVEQAITSVEEIAARGSSGMAGEAISMLGALRAWIGDFDRARAIVDRGIEEMNAMGLHGYAAAIRGLLLGQAEEIAGNVETAESVMLDAYESLAARGDLAFSASIAGQLAQLYARQGRFEQAERFATVAQERTSRDDVDAQARALAALAMVRAAGGDLGSAVQTIEDAIRMIDATDYSVLRAEVHEMAGDVYVAAGDRDRAIAELRQAVLLYEEKGATVLVDRTTGALERLNGSR